MMNRITRFLSTAAILTAPAIALTPAPAAAYQIDCAILLCLAGGWPSSPECTLARMEFIRRITPWPIEPPLQIWRCPLGASYQAESPSVRLWSIASTDLPQQSQPTEPQQRIRQLAYRVSTGQRADIDISDPDFDFVRSIKVYDIDWHQWYRASGDSEYCWQLASRVRIGTYGRQGDFGWANFNILDAPDWIGLNFPPHWLCEAHGRFRGVAIEWTDYFGNHGYEVVRY